MLNAVTAINHLGESITMELRNPEKSGFLITSVTGIGAPKTDVHITDLATIDGGYFNSAKSQTRNIVLDIRFYSEDNDNIEALRQKTYKYFPVKKPISLIFENDNRIGEITGYVESNEPNIFSKEESCQISVLCPYPYFYDAFTGDRVIKFSESIPRFEFPFSNELFQEEYNIGYFAPHIIFSEISLERQYNVEYNGDAEIGMLVTLAASGSVLNPSFYNVTNGDTIRLLTSMNNGDQIIISTIRGAKSVKRLRNGTYTNILNSVERDSAWPVLQRGENLLGYVAEEGTDNLTVTVSHKTIFEGM